VSDGNDTQGELVGAIQAQQVASRFDGAAPGGDIARAVETCHAIGRRMETETVRVVELLTATGIDVVARSGSEPRQIHKASVTVPGRDEARHTTDLLTAHGWRRLHDWSGGADRSFWNNSGTVPLLRTADATLTLGIRLGDHLPGSPVSRLLRPGPSDWATVSLPSSLGWAYRAVRPLRLVGSRLGVPTPVAPAPFLSTPDDLIQHLLHAVEAGPDDVVVDLGCGDGRLVIAAAERSGCRAIGVEAVAERVQTARERAARSPAAGRIEIHEGNAFEEAVDDATIILMFLPLEAVTIALPGLLERLRPGTRVLVHEQLPLPDRLQPRPERSFPVIAPESLTVAHLWTSP
jgi:hypothetical protein